jgi:hypothetical protein
MHMRRFTRLMNADSRTRSPRKLHGRMPVILDHWTAWLMSKEAGENQ